MPQSSRVPADDELFITREFAAPLALLWRMWESRELMMRWWGPEGFTVTELDRDFRVGGRWRVGMISERYGKSWSGGVFREIVPGPSGWTSTSLGRRAPAIRSKRWRPTPSKKRPAKPSSISTRRRSARSSRAIPMSAAGIPCSTSKQRSPWHWRQTPHRHRPETSVPKTAISLLPLWEKVARSDGCGVLAPPDRSAPIAQPSPKVALKPSACYVLRRVPA